MASEVERLHEKVQQLKSKLNEKEKKVSEKDSEIKELKLKLSSDPTLNAEHIEELEGKITQLKMIVVDLYGKIEVLRGEIRRLEADIVHSNNRMQRLEEQVGELIDKHWLYIGEVALKFCENAYKFVMGDPLYKQCYPYYLTDVVSNIKYYFINDRKNRKKAFGKLKEFKSKVGWNFQTVKAVKEVRKRRITVAHCLEKPLDTDKAAEAIEELNRKNELIGYISRPNVQKIVSMWEISCNLE